LKAALEKSPITISVKAGKTGRLFGSVTRTSIVGAIEAAGINGVDKRAIEIPQAVKVVGDSEALITIHEGVIATVKLSVVAEK